MVNLIDDAATRDLASEQEQELMPTSAPAADSTLPDPAPPADTLAEDPAAASARPAPMSEAEGEHHGGFLAPPQSALGANPNQAEEAPPELRGRGRPPDSQFAFISMAINGEKAGVFEQPFTKEQLVMSQEQVDKYKRLMDFDLQVDVSAKFMWKKIPFFLSADKSDEHATGFDFEAQERLELLGHKFEQFLHHVAGHKHSREVRELLAKARRSGLEHLATKDPTAVSASEMELLMQHEQYFAKLREAINASSEVYSVAVYFKDVSLVAEVANQGTVPPRLRSAREDVWTASVKLLCGLCLKTTSNIAAKAKSVPLKRQKPILDRCSGVLRPGRLTLLLGPPGAGKTTLMRVLMGNIKTKKGKQEVTGSVHYNSHPIDTIHTPNFAMYVDQIDEHIPILTTKETLDFAYECKLPNVEQLASMGNLSKEQSESLKALTEARVKFVLSTLGLVRAADTIIGNDVMKGVSGGEKRRVTLGEMLVAGTSKVLFLDEISTGLDSAATYDITKALLASTRIIRSTAVVALLQPPPETYDLFDDILLVDTGRIVYHGPRKEIVGHFEKLGFQKPDGKDIGDWLQEVTTKDGAKYLKPGATGVPQTTDEFVAAFQETDIYKAMAAELEEDPSAHASTHWSEQYMLGQKKYMRTFSKQLALLVRRQGSVVIRNKAFIAARILQNLIMGLLLGLLMLQLNFDEYFLKAMLMFQFLAFNSFSSAALLNDVLASRNVYYKQSRMNFYGPTAYVFADIIVAFPLHCFDSLVFGTLVYFMCGLTLAMSGAHYFMFIFIAISYAITMGQVVRFLGYISPTSNAAFALVVLVVVIFMFFSGGIATFDVIPDYWIWVYWMAPMSWAYRSFQQNEYLSDDYTQGTGCCVDGNGDPDLCSCDPCVAYGQTELNCGEYFLASRQFQTESFFMWTGVAFCWGWTIVMITASILGLIYIRHDSQSSELPAEQDTEGPKEGDILANACEKARVFSLSQGNLPVSPEGTFSPLSVIPFETCELVFREVVYTLELPGSPDERGRPQTVPVDLLKGVSGYAKPYRMTALMGSSGAGKTTLLDVLADRKTQGEIKGDFIVNGKRKDKDTFVKQMGYVEQFGVHCPAATVFESVMFSADLRLPASSTPEQRRKLVEDQMELLELDTIRDKLVGTVDGAGLSFEETKRITIAVELAANPAILFLDEPTSGLDARAAAIVMGGMKKIAATGRSLVCTIHQPSAAIFSMFDDLLLMKRGGEVVFFGELGEGAQNLKDYFEAMPGVRKCPEAYNPATWMLEVIGAGTGASSQATDYAAEYKDSALYDLNISYIDSMAAKLSLAEPEIGQTDKASPYATSSYRQFQLVTKRMFTEYWRSPTYSLVRWVVIAIFSLILGSIYWQQKTSSAAEVQSRVSLLGLVVQIIGQYNVMTVIPFMFERKALYYREKASNMYSPFIYAFCAGFVEIPFVFVECALSVNILYWMVGFSSDPIWHFWYFWLVILLFTIGMTYLGQLVSQLMPNSGAATLVAVLYLQLMALFAGTIVPGAQIPEYLIWLSYMSPLRWATEGVIVTQFFTDDAPICVPVGIPDPITETCTDSGVYTTAGEYVLGDPNAEPGDPGFPGLFGGTNGYRYDFRWWDVLFLACYIWLVRLCTFFAANRISYEKR